ncbi:MAG: T9SS type A sorting domain-containing protein [bacterium]
MKITRDAVKFNWLLVGCSMLLCVLTVSSYGSTPLLNITRMLDGGDSHTVALKADGTVFSWGYNSNGELGDGTEVNKTKPVHVIGLEGKKIVAVSAGDQHSFALADDGSVWMWGDNDAYQLNNGTVYDKSIPEQIRGLKDKTVIALSAGEDYALALADDGSVWGWGENSDGQLGDGTKIDKNILVQVINLQNKKIIAVSAGKIHSLALADDGSVWAWGDNGDGKLGDGTVNDSAVPVKVAGLEDKKIVAIAASYVHSVVLGEDGSVWAWGHNVNGELGNGTKTNSNIPVQVIGLEDKTIIGVAVGYDHTLVLTRDGSVWAWGRHDNGELGDGTKDDKSIPVQVIGVEGKHIISVSAGEEFSFALADDGSVWAWGDNNFGQLGDGTKNERLNPVRVLGLDGVGFIDLGPFITLTGIETNIGAQGERLKLKITGSNFSEGTRISFSGTGITVNKITFVNSQELEVNIAIDYNAPLESRTIIVTNEYNISAISKDAFTVTTVHPPLVEGLSIVEVEQKQILDFTVHGNNFFGDMRVSLSGTGITVNSVKVISETELIVNITVAIDAPAGPRSITLINEYNIETNVANVLIVKSAYRGVNQTRAYPVPFNPVKNAGITFDKLPNQATIKIYTITGNLVKEINKNDASEKFVWNGKNSAGGTIASGIYIVYIDSPEGSKSIKIAVKK